MKTTNIVLGLSAFFFAVGASLASPVLTLATYVKPSGVCRQITQIDCGQAGQLVCQAQIVTGTPTGTFTVYKDLADCEDGVVTTGGTTVPRTASYVIW